jgi:hypothetical protein
MPPVGLLALAALGLVFVYALPDRIREVGQYAVVRTEGRYRADMQVIRSSAARVDAETAHPAAGKRSRGLAPREARASIKALGGSVMSRPAAPLDRAAIVARRQMVTMQRDRDRILARRAAQARRRATIGVLSVFATSVTWGFVAATAWPLWSAIAASTALGGITIAGRRAVRAQKTADRRLVPVAQEVVVAATATAALQRVTVERAAGHEVRPSIEETQAIKIVIREAVSTAPARPSTILPEGEGEQGWSPGMLPIPTYTLKPAAKIQTPRPISEDDLVAGRKAAERAAQWREAPATAPEEATVEPEATTQTLDDILARRRRKSA